MIEQLTIAQRCILSVHLEGRVEFEAIWFCETVIFIECNCYDPSLVELFKVDIADIYSMSPRRRSGNQVSKSLLFPLREDCSGALVEWFTTDDDVGDHEAWGSEDAEGLQDALQVEALSHGFTECPL